MSDCARTKSTVLFFSYYFPPINAVGALRTGRFAKYLVEQGWRTIAIAGNVERGLPNSADRRFVPGGGEPRLGLRLGSLAGRVVQKLVSQHSDRLDWLPYALEEAASILKAEPVQAIFSSSPPISNHIAACRVKRKYGLKWIADFRDPLRESPFRTGFLIRQHDRILEPLLFREADVLTTVTDEIARQWGSRYPACADKMQVLWNGFDPEEVVTPEKAEGREHRLMAHVGDLYGARHPGLLLSSLDRLRERGDEGAGTVKLELTGPIETSGLAGNPAFERLTSRGVVSYNNARVPRAEAMQAIAQADFLLLLDLNSQNAGYTVPAKLFDYLRMGHPILAFTAQDSVVSRILGQAGVPHGCVSPIDPESAIDEKVSRFLRLSTEPVFPNEWFWQNFDGRRQADRLADLLNGLIHGS